LHVPPPDDAPPRTGRNLPLVLGGVAALGLGLLLVSVVPRPATVSVQVCSTTMTARLVSELVRSYAAQGGAPSSRFAVAAGEGRVCGVRFWTTSKPATPGKTIAHDGLVAIVNPQNGISQLREDQLRDIFTGHITDWSGVGGSSGAIEAYLPKNGTDEARALGGLLFHDAAVGDRVQRTDTSADVVRAVTSANGARRVGIVAFSGAVPAKVLALAGALPPSTLSIGDGRYPLSLAVEVESDLRSPAPDAAALLHFARSKSAQPVIVRTGLVAKDGF
jgi:hypothetical protein